MCRRQEAYERELEKYAVRRNPLGMDRHHRYYWCATHYLVNCPKKRPKPELT